MTSRRQFLAAGGGLLAASAARATTSSRGAFPYAELEARIARRDFRDITKDVLPTPSMIVDLDLFEQNLNRMAAHAKAGTIAQAPGVYKVPASAYTDEARFKREIDLIFKRMPLMLAPSAELPNPGDYKAMTPFGTSA